MVNQSLLNVQRQLPKYVEARPLRWYHLIAFAAVLALPFVQWFAFLNYQTWLSFLAPLAVTVCLIFVVLGFFPRFVSAEQSKKFNHWKALRSVAIVAVTLAVALLMPSTGMMIVLRGVFTDILALMLVGYLMAVVQKKPTENSRQAQPER